MRRSSQSGNQQPKQHLLSGLQCRKRLVADILFWDGKQWIKQLTQTGQEYPLPLSFTAAFCGVANDIGSGTRLLGVEIRTSTFIIYIKDNPSGTIQLIAIGR